MSSEANFEYLKTLTASSDQQAIFQELMANYGKDVWNYAFSMTRKWDQADDITQEVFVKVFRSLYSFRSESSVKTWLLAITRNTVLDFKRSAFYRRVTLVDFITGRGEHRSAEQEALENSGVNDLWEQVLTLPAKYREVLVLFAHYQLSMKEMAEVLGVSEGTVKSRLHHARNKLMRERDNSLGAD